MPVCSRWVSVVAIVGLGLGPAAADERSDAVARQKAAAQTKLDAAKLKLSFAESDDLLLYAPGSAEKVKALVATLQKTYTLAAKALQYDAKETPWTGKLTVFVITGSRPFKSFVLDALQRLPESGERSVIELRGDSPYLLLALESEKPTDGQIATEASIQVAATLLSRKAGIGRSALVYSLPDWLKTGFGRAVLLRSDGSGSRMSDHKQKVRALMNRSRGTAFQAAAVWGDAVNPQSELLTISLAEYLAFGPAAEKFPALLAGFKPQDENTPAPTIDAVLAGLEWKLEELEASWRKWAAMGK